MFWYLFSVSALCATEVLAGSELLGVKWNNPLVPPACRESFVSKELKVWILMQQLANQHCVSFIQLNYTV